jgi:protoporphyrinogen oxidase
MPCPYASLRDFVCKAGSRVQGSKKEVRLGLSNPWTLEPYLTSLSLVPFVAFVVKDADNGMEAEAGDQRAIAILGAGVAGLATAWQLAEAGRHRVIILEKAEQAGGLAATVGLDGARLDIGSHRIHSDYFPEALTLLRTLLGDELLEVPRRGRLRLKERYVPYPPMLVDFLAALGPVEIARCAAAFVGARLRRRPTQRSYEDYLVPRVGRRAYDLFYAPYARKLFGLEPDQVALSAAKTRISTGSPLRLAAQILARRRAPARADVFYYPAGGFGSIPQALLDAARGRGVTLRTGVTVQSLSIEGTRIGSVAFDLDGASTTVPVDAVVSTIPLAQLVRLVQPAAPASVGEAAAGLRWRGIRLLQVLIDRSRCLDGETYYFPEERYCFGRISEPAQFSSRLRSRSDRTALNIEVICSPGDAVWSLDEAQFFAHVLRDVRAIDLFRPDEVLEYRSLRVPAVYPVYDLAYRDRLAHVLAWVASFDNLYSIGRGGMFLHGNTDHSIHLGLRLAEHLARPDARAASWSSHLGAEEFTVRD